MNNCFGINFQVILSEKNISFYPFSLFTICLFSFAWVDHIEMRRNPRPTELFNLSLKNDFGQGNIKYKEKSTKRCADICNLSDLLRLVKTS